MPDAPAKALAPWMRDAGGFIRDAKDASKLRGYSLPRAILQKLAGGA